jgi:hypothetical protein
MPGYGIETELTEEMVPWSAVTDQLKEARSYWIVTASPTGRPHAMPVWGLWLEDAFYFSTDPSSVKGRNLAANPRLVVHLESGDDVVILEGSAERLSGEAIPTSFADAYEAKYGIRLDTSDPAFGIYRVRPQVAFAWREKDFPKSATRWRFQSV